MTNKSLDVRDFRRALGKFPTGVTIITTNDAEGNPVGVTASSFNTVSIDPALILWSVDKGAYSASIFQNAEHFAVNVLSKTQIDMSNRFAGRGEDKFNGVDYAKSAHGSPLFNDCAAQFECKTWNVYDGGDHYIIVGEVVDYRYVEGNAPLVFAGGSYGVSMQHPSTASNESLKLPGDGFLGDYLLYLLRMAYTKCSAQLYPQLLETYGINSEEWRVLTLLADAGEAEADRLAEVVGQPINVFSETFERMQAAGHVQKTADQKIQLTDAGQEMAGKVFALAREQESLMLSDLSAEQRSVLKASLQNIIKTM